MALPAIRPSARPARPARRAAVQRSDIPPSGPILDTHGLGRTTALDTKWLTRYQDWQDWARRYARTLGVVRFANGITADTCARCDLRIEERQADGDWAPADDNRLAGIFDAYRNPRHSTPELIRLHAWHYQTAGELAQVITDGQSGVDWWVYSVRAIEWRKRNALVRDAPNGTPREGTAFEVPRNQVTRMWIPDEEWPAYATSPMAASIDDLHRYASLARYVRRFADSRLAMNGVLWTPGEAHERGSPGREDPGAGADQPGSQLERDFYQVAQAGFEDDDSIAALAPFMVKWPQQYGAPEWVEIGRPIDEHLLEHVEAALKDFARGVNLPTQLVVGGDTNHWTEWLIDERYFNAAVAPTMNRITHQDLTATFLPPVLRILRLPADRFRVGYDETPVVVRPDQSDQSLKLHLAGLLKGSKALEESGFSPDDLMGSDELARLLDILSKGAAGEATPVRVSTETPVGPGNVDRSPPVAPGQPRAAAALNPTGRGAMVYLPVADPEAIALEGGEPADAMHLTLFHLASDVDELDPAVRDQVLEALRGAAPTMSSPSIDLTHVERFPAGDNRSDGEELEPVVLVSDAPGVYELRERLRVALERAGVVFSDDHAFRAHVTLGYWAPSEGPAPGPVEGIPHTWSPDVVTLAWGQDHEPVPFGDGSPGGGGQRAQAGAPDAGGITTNGDTAGDEGPDPAEIRRTERLFGRLARIRRDFGRDLLAGANLAFAEALRRAGVKVQVRARRRSASVRSAVAAAVESGGPLGGLLAQVGITEAELLDESFTTYAGQAGDICADQHAAIRAALEREGLDPDEILDADDESCEAAAGFLGAGLAALAAQRLTEGVGTDPERASAIVPATIVTAAIAIALGRAAARPGATLDEDPVVVALDRRSLEERIAARLAPERAVTWRWDHGFYGAPTKPFPPHRELDGHVTQEPDGLAWVPGDHTGCFPAGTVVSGPVARGSTTRWYEGPLVKLTFASGAFLTATPNHPVLTTKGWVGVGFLDEGDDVLRCADGEAVTRLVPDQHQVPALIEDVAAAVGITGEVSASAVPVAAEDFHGDGTGSEIAVVRTDRLLQRDVDATVAQPPGEPTLVGVRERARRLASTSGTAERLEAVGSAALGGVGSSGDAAALVGAPTGSDRPQSLADRALSDASRREAPGDRATRDAVPFGEALDGRPGQVLGGEHVGAREEPSDPFELGFTPDAEALELAAKGRGADVGGSGGDLDALAGAVAVDRICQVERVGRWEGHVFNLDTGVGWYVADGVLVHNCTCSWVPVGVEQRASGEILSGPSEVRGSRRVPRQEDWPANPRERKAAGVR